MEPNNIGTIGRYLHPECSSENEIVAGYDESKESIDSRKHSSPDIPSESLYFVSVFLEEDSNILHVCFDPTNRGYIVSHEQDFSGSLWEEFTNLFHPAIVSVLFCYPFGFVRKLFPDSFISVFFWNFEDFFGEC
ncbi:MAG: hypothetical protein ACD_78C00381G0001, partial [uncultured bacterium (gcode 4)]